MDLQLAGTKALVMASTNGIGRAISEAFLAERAFVTLGAGHGSPRAGHVNRVNVTVDGGFLKRVDYR